MRDELSPELAITGREIGLALRAELEGVLPPPAGWLAIRELVLAPETVRRRRRSPIRMAFVVAVVVAASLLAAAVATAVSDQLGRRGAIAPQQQLGRSSVPAQIAQAERDLGFHVLQLTGYPAARLVSVEKLGPAASPPFPGGPSLSAPPGIRLVYELGSGRVTIGEFTGSSATVAPGGRPGQIERIGDRDVLVTTDGGGAVTGMLWTQDGITVAVGFTPGVPHAEAVALLSHLR